MPRWHTARSRASGCWCSIPIRVVIWAVREDGKGLFSGDKAALRPGQVFGAFVIASALSMIGAFVASKLGQRASADG